MVGQTGLPELPGVFAVQALIPCRKQIMSIALDDAYIFLSNNLSIFVFVFVFILYRSTSLTINRVYVVNKISLLEHIFSANMRLFKPLSSAHIENNFSANMRLFKPLSSAWAYKA
jgi:uncharacterized membrane protein